MRILIVDDSAVMRKVIERAFRQAGAELSAVINAANGLEALDILRTADPLDLVVTDINMPGMDGIEFLEQRRAQSLATGVPIVIITTENSEPLVKRAIAAGARGYLCKPFTTEQIKARLGSLLSTPVPATH